MIDPQIWRNEKVGRLSDAGRLLFIGIFSQADDDGRLKAAPRFLMANIFPYDKNKAEDDIKRLRDQCAELGLIRVYTKSKEEYLDIPGWHEHQQIRKDRYIPSTLPCFKKPDNQPTTAVEPSGDHLATSDQPNIIKSSLVKSKTPKGARIKRADPIVNEIFIEMRTYLGYPDKVKEDPIPSYGKEGQSIKRMLARGFTRGEILACWRSKISQRGGEFVSMTWVNEDIGKKGGRVKKPGQLPTEEELDRQAKEKGVA